MEVPLPVIWAPQLPKSQIPMCKVLILLHLMGFQGIYVEYKKLNSPYIVRF
jgi:hypothetical protein